jgi:hypothetical protein
VRLCQRQRPDPAKGAGARLRPAPFTLQNALYPNALSLAPFEGAPLARCASNPQRTPACLATPYSPSRTCDVLSPNVSNPPHPAPPPAAPARRSQDLKIVPGTVVSKSGKTYTVVLVVACDDAKPADQQPCHVFQCAHREDAAHMHAEVKRMWKDHIFSNLLDVSTEEGQQGFDSFMIRQDMAAAAARCTELIADDAHEANDRCAKLMKAELDSFDFLDMIAGMGDAPPAPRAATPEGCNQAFAPNPAPRLHCWRVAPAISTDCARIRAMHPLLYSKKASLQQHRPTGSEVPRQSTVCTVLH